MYPWAIAFLSGVLLLAALPDPPDTLFAGFLPMLALLAVFSSRPLRLLAWFGMGFGWALFRAGIGMADSLPMALEGRDMAVEGVIASIPVQVGRRTRFLLDVVQVEDPVAEWGQGKRIRLDWYGPSPRLLPGERWRLTVRLKRPRGFRNPGGFDYERWLFRQGIRATGYVRWAGENREIVARASQWSLDRVRYRLAEEIEATLGGGEGGGPPHAAIVKALSIGVRDGVTVEQWTTLRETGTAHLMAISGLHIGLVAGLMFFAARWLWVLFPTLTLLIPAQRLAAPVAVIGAFGYAALAGFSLPTQRALVMVCVVMAGIFRRRHTTPGFSLAPALLAILLLDPFSVLSFSFWLSFAAVAVILFGMTGRLGARKPWWWRWGRVQLVIAIGLAPLSLLFFHQHPLVGLVANPVAIPWIGFVAIPLILAGICLVIPFPELGGPLLAGGEWAIAALWPLLTSLESLDWVYRKGLAPPLWTVLAGGVGVFLLLLPRGMPGRWLGVVWLLPLFLVPVPRPAEGEVWFTLLDVGQGLAAVARTRDHVLVYDTGPAYGPGFDAAKAALIPFLRSRGIASVDGVVISHEDADHAGGLASLLAGFPVDAIFTNAVSTNNGKQNNGKQNDGKQTECRDGVRWRWNGVEFRFLYPPPGEGVSGNNGSCVLAIANSAGRILLTGDIEWPAERRLVQRHGNRLRADVLVAPHHGSDTSSSEALLAVARPRYALFSVGYRNRFGLPSEAVLARYARSGARPLFSDRDGAIGFRLTPGKGVSAPTLYREQARRFWHDNAPRHDLVLGSVDISPQKSPNRLK